jgi:hypothetical protein
MFAVDEELVSADCGTVSDDFAGRAENFDGFAETG